MDIRARTLGGTGAVESRFAVRRSAQAASVLVLGVEATASLAMWAPVPFGWFWVGAHVYDATGSVAADMGVALLGFLVTMSLAMVGLARVDRAWVALRRRAGHAQPKGALTQVVVASAAVGLLAFMLWFYVLSGDAFLIPFMPTH